jgi:hypothetical protein
MRHGQRFLTLWPISRGDFYLLQIAGALLLILSLAACADSAAAVPPVATSSAMKEFQTTTTPKTPATHVGIASSDSPSSLPADLESYYKTMVFIEGTAQLMSKFDLTTLSDGNTGMLALIAIPGIMDDRVIATEDTPLPDELAPAWNTALEARDGILKAYEALLTTASQEDFIKQLNASESLASQAVTETESILAAAGTSGESLAQSHRAALTEMGEAYQNFTSLILVGQSQNQEDSQ